MKTNPSVLFNSLRHHGLYSLWNSPGENTGVGSLSLLQGIPSQGLNPGFLHCRQILYLLSHKGIPVVKNLHPNAEDIRNVGLIPGLGRSPGGGHDNPLQYSCLENPHGERSLADYSLWGRKEWDTIETTAHTCEVWL